MDPFDAVPFEVTGQPGLPAARLPGQDAGLVPADEVLRLGHKRLLGRILLGLPLAPGRPLLPVRGVVALVLGQGMPVQLPDPGRHLFQERVAVRHHDYAARPILQGSDQPRQRSFVQVVGGFVEQQKLRLFQENMSQVQPGALAAAQIRHGRLPAGLRDPQVVQRLLQPTLHGVAAPRLERGLHPGIAFQQFLVPGTLCGRLECGRQALQLFAQLLQLAERGAQEVQHREADGARRLLGQVADGQVPAVGQPPVEVVVQAPDGPQQRGLAAAVGADQPDAVALANHEVQVREDQIVAIPLFEGAAHHHAHVCFWCRRTVGRMRSLRGPEAPVPSDRGPEWGHPRPSDGSDSVTISTNGRLI